jgi:hypothetical protein
MKPEDREEETSSSLKEVCPLGGSGERRSSRLEGSPKLKARFEDNLHKDWKSTKGSDNSFLIMNRNEEACRLRIRIFFARVYS